MQDGLRQRANGCHSSAIPSIHMVDLVENLTKISQYTPQYLKVDSNRMQARYDLQANTAGFKRGDRVRLHRFRKALRRSPKLQSLLEGPRHVLHRLNDVVFRIQLNSRSKKIAVHSDRLVPYQGAATDEQL